MQELEDVNGGSTDEPSTTLAYVDKDSEYAVIDKKAVQPHVCNGSGDAFVKATSLESNADNTESTTTTVSARVVGDGGTGGHQERLKRLSSQNRLQHNDEDDDTSSEGEEAFNESWSSCEEDGFEQPEKIKPDSSTQPTSSRVQPPTDFSEVEKISNKSFDNDSKLKETSVNNTSPTNPDNSNSSRNDSTSSERNNSEEVAPPTKEILNSTDTHDPTLQSPNQQCSREIDEKCDLTSSNKGLKRFVDTRITLK